MLRWYGAVSRLGLNVRILHPGSAWPEHLKMIIVPAMQMIDETLVKRLDEYSAAGGHLILTCRTGLMNKHGHLWEGPAAQPILPLIGARIESYDSLPEGATGHIDLEGNGQHAWNVWGDLLHPDEETKVIAWYADQFYADTPAVTSRRNGKGRVIYSGVYGEPSFHNTLVEMLVLDAGLPCTPLPDRVFVYQRGPCTICLNYTDKPVAVPAPDGAKFVIGSAQMEAAGVAVWL